MMVVMMMRRRRMRMMRMMGMASMMMIIKVMMMLRSIIRHPLTQVADNGSQVPLQYRYRVVPDQKVNAFKPKDLAASDDKHQLRSAMFGAVFSGSYNTLPSADHARVIWEVILSDPNISRPNSSLLVERFKNPTSPKNP